MPLLLVRHGRSALPTPRGALSRDDVARWERSYDETAIADDSAPPSALLAEVARADVVASSDLARARSSAARLAPGRPVLVVPHFREVPLALPRRMLARAPFGIWALAIHARWIAGALRGVDATAADLARAGEAAAWCEELFASSDTEPLVAVVTHGVMRRLAARELERRGWRPAGVRRWHHWSVWRLSPP